jgi:hypothetical protein
MTRPDLQKLLGGYAAGTLTPEEQRALFDAALADQTLFDALADEQALREVLADPACRERVRAALVEEPRIAWWRRWPAVWAFAAAAAVAVVLTVIVLRPKPMPPAPRQVAMDRKVELPQPYVPAPAQAPQGADSRAQATAPETPRAVQRQLAAARPQPRMFAAPAPAMPQPPALAAKARLPEAAAKEDLAAPPGPGSVGGAVHAPPPPPPPPPAPAAQTVTVTGASEMVATAEPAPSAEQDRLDKKQSADVSRSRMALQALPAFGLRYTVLRRDVEVPPDTAFSRGELARLRIEAGRDGYLYVLAGKRPLYTGPVHAGQFVFLETKPGVLHAILVPGPDPGSLSTLFRRTRRAGPAAGIVAEISIKSR